MAKKKATKKKAARKIRKLRTAVIGVGSMGMRHSESVRKRVPEMELVAVVDANLEQAEKVGKKFKVPVFKNHQELIKSGLAEAVIIATPHPLHLKTCLDCIKAKMHVLCEKPLAETISSADKMVKAAKKYRVKLGVMFQRRFEPAISKALEIVRSGKLGKIQRTIMISPEYRTQAYYDSGSWRATWEGEGGGVMMNQAPHVIDIFVQLAGLPVSVNGNIKTLMHNIEVEDFAEATLKYKDGGTGYFYTSTNELKPGQMIEIVGDKGKLIWRDSNLEFWRYEPAVPAFTKKTKEMWGVPKKIQEVYNFKPVDQQHYHVIRNFARHLVLNERLECSGESGLASLELTNAIMLSSFKGKEVKLPISRREYDAELKRLREKSTFKKKVRPQMQCDPQFK
ncbi:MAG: Gfo/Idh/MocA family oxidoreductase [Planctomycetes bacterium]|nr:Gfo/Idh/MocA family oxidoreductase [Planctomycetota bacterium]